MTSPIPIGGKIDESLTIQAVRVAVLTVSDTRDEESDTSGHLLAERVKNAGHELADKRMVHDDIVTTGGTGLTGRDVTPEAVRPLFDKEIDGFSVVFHLVSYQSVGLSTLQSRALAGLVKGVFVFCLPGSNGAVRDGWDKVIAAQLDSRHRPCNMVELMPRLLEK